MWRGTKRWLTQGGSSRVADEVLGRQMARAWHSNIQVTLRVVCCLPKHLKKKKGKICLKLDRIHDFYKFLSSHHVNVEPYLRSKRTPYTQELLRKNITTPKTIINNVQSMYFSWKLNGEKLEPQAITSKKHVKKCYTY